jgi:putrescine aminotransferase
MRIDRTNRESVLDAYRRHLSRGRASMAELTGTHLEWKSSGARVWDITGREFLDCGGYGVFILGHCHPQVTAAVIEQIQRHPLATRLLLDPVAADAAAILAGVSPPGLSRVHFVNSGAEATETAIKLARAHGKRNLISTHGGYHGKTAGALSVTANDLYQAPFRPLLPGVQHVPYGDTAALAAALARGTNHCVIMEPVQGEAGVIFPPSGYLREVERLCQEHNALFVLDEIQTGLGRLGHWWGANVEGVRPDILLVGKNLSGGVVPVAAVVATEAAYRPFDRDPFLHTSTFAGSPVAMAAAAAAITTISADGLIDRARHIGEHLLAELRTLLEGYPELVAEVRGMGLLIGVELRAERLAGELILELLERGVIVNHSLNAHKVIRLTPPAVLDETEIGWLLDAFASAAITDQFGFIPTEKGVLCVMSASRPPSREPTQTPCSPGSPTSKVIRSIRKQCVRLLSPRWTTRYRSRRGR